MWVASPWASLDTGPVCVLVFGFKSLWAADMWMNDISSCLRVSDRLFKQNAEKTRPESVRMCPAGLNIKQFDDPVFCCERWRFLMCRAVLKNADRSLTDTHFLRLFFSWLCSEATTWEMIWCCRKLVQTNSWKLCLEAVFHASEVLVFLNRSVLQ